MLGRHVQLYSFLPLNHIRNGSCITCLVSYFSFVCDSGVKQCAAEATAHRIQHLSAHHCQADCQSWWVPSSATLTIKSASAPCSRAAPCALPVIRPPRTLPKEQSQAKQIIDAQSAKQLIASMHSATVKSQPFISFPFGTSHQSSSQRFARGTISQKIKSQALGDVQAVHDPSTEQHTALCGFGGIGPCNIFTAVINCVSQITGMLLLLICSACTSLKQVCKYWAANHSEGCCESDRMYKLGSAVQKSADRSILACATRLAMSIFPGFCGYAFALNAKPDTAMFAFIFVVPAVCITAHSKVLLQAFSH